MSLGPWGIAHNETDIQVERLQAFRETHPSIRIHAPELDGWPCWRAEIAGRLYQNYDLRDFIDQLEEATKGDGMEKLI